MTLADLDINADGLIASESEKADIIQCIRTLILTPEGTVPLYREFGLNTEFIGAPQGVAKNLLAVEIMDKVATFEPRASVSEVQTEADPDTGQIRIKVVITNG
jgi:phage baseplate assembly protein W